MSSKRITGVVYRKTGITKYRLYFFKRGAKHPYEFEEFMSFASAKLRKGSFTDACDAEGEDIIVKIHRHLPIDWMGKEWRRKFLLTEATTYDLLWHY